MSGIKEYSPNAAISVAVPLEKKRKPKMRLDLSNSVNTTNLINPSKSHNTQISLGGQYDFDSGAFGYNAGVGYSKGGKQIALNFHNIHNPNFQLPKLTMDKTTATAPQVSLSSGETQPLLTYNYLDYSR